MDKIFDYDTPTGDLAKFFILDDTEESWICGEIEFDENFEQFIALIKEEIEYSWGSDFSDMNNYLIYYIDTSDKNTLKLIEDETIYCSLKNHDERFIAIIHKAIPYKIIANIPPLFDWFMEDSLY